MKVRATRGDSGRVFSCDAHNGLGITLNANVTLNVVCESKVYRVFEGVRMDVKMGEVAGCPTVL